MIIIEGCWSSKYFAKASTSLMSPYVKPQFEAHLPLEQCGGVSGKGTDFANHLIRTCIDLCNLTSKCMFILYIDLTNAFDRAVRELALGWPHFSKCERTKLLKSFGFCDADIPEIIRYVDAPVLEEIGVHPHIIHMMNSLHTAAWFKFGASSDFLISKRGGRQCCRFGGLIFNLIYNCALREVKSILDKQNMLTKVKGITFHPPWSRTVGLPHAEAQALFDATFVDDEAIAVIPPNPNFLNSLFVFHCSDCLQGFQQVCVAGQFCLS